MNEAPAILDRPSPFDLLEAVAAEAIQNDPSARIECPVRHFFPEGLYVREFSMPKDAYVGSVIHDVEHQFFITKGVVTVIHEDGERQTYHAPYFGTTKPGTRRWLYSHEDVVWVTIHPNPDNETDPAKIVERVTQPHTNTLLNLTHKQMHQAQYPALSE